MRVSRFIFLQLFTTSFWYLFLASFTLVLMMAWRAQLRDQIFKSAIGKYPRTRY